jgi:hypothetical protein
VAQITKELTNASAVVVPFILLSARLSPRGVDGEGLCRADIEDAGQRHACFDALVPERKAAPLKP